MPERATGRGSLGGGGRRPTPLAAWFAVLGLCTLPLPCARAEAPPPPGLEPLAEPPPPPLMEPANIDVPLAANGLLLFTYSAPVRVGEPWLEVREGSGDVLVGTIEELAAPEAQGYRVFRPDPGFSPSTRYSILTLELSEVETTPLPVTLSPPLLLVDPVLRKATRTVAEFCCPSAVADGSPCGVAETEEVVELTLDMALWGDVSASRQFLYRVTVAGPPGEFRDARSFFEDNTYVLDELVGYCFQIEAYGLNDDRLVQLDSQCVQNELGELAHDVPTEEERASALAIEACLAPWSDSFDRWCEVNREVCAEDNDARPQACETASYTSRCSEHAVDVTATDDSATDMDAVTQGGAAGAGGQDGVAGSGGGEAGTGGQDAPTGDEPSEEAASDASDASPTTGAGAARAGPNDAGERSRPSEIADVGSGAMASAHEGASQDQTATQDVRRSGCSASGAASDGAFGVAILLLCARRRSWLSGFSRAGS